MIKCLKLLPFLLAGAIMLLAQNPLNSPKPTQKCVLDDLSTALGQEPRAATTCTPPPAGNWTFLEKVFASNYGTWAYTASGAVNVPQGSCSGYACVINFPITVPQGATIYFQPFWYAGSVINMTSCDKETPVNVPPQYHAQLANPSQMQIGSQYVLSANGGYTQLICYFDTISSGWQAIAPIVGQWYGNGGVAFDTAAAKLASCGTTNTGVGLNLSGSTDWVITTNTPFESNANNVGAPYSMVAAGNYADALNVSSAPAPIWSQPPPVNGASIDVCAYGAIAFTGR